MEFITKISLYPNSTCVDCFKWHSRLKISRSCLEQRQWGGREVTEMIAPRMTDGTRHLFGHYTETGCGWPGFSWTFARPLWLVFSCLSALLGVLNISRGEFIRECFQIFAHWPISILVVLKLSETPAFGLLGQSLHCLILAGTPLFQFEQNSHPDLASLQKSLWYTIHYTV